MVMVLEGEAPGPTCISIKKFEKIPIVIFI
jgi:hypothetical protein